jgi:hypothetical protein
MKTAMVVLAMVLMATTVMAEGFQCPPPPCPECQPVQVTCNCAAETRLEGLYKVNINGKIRCGEITIIANGFLLEEGGRPSIDITPTLAQGDVYFLSNAWKRLERVQSCD